EFQLKKKRSNNKGLRVDAVVFSANGKHNIAIDSKFPLENYLSSADSSLTAEQKEEFEKKFENDVKEHIKKVSEYISYEVEIKKVFTHLICHSSRNTIVIRPSINNLVYYVAQ